MADDQKTRKEKKRRQQIVLALTCLAVLFGAAAAWRWTPLADQIDMGKLAGWTASLRNHPARALIIFGAYLFGSLLLVPITVLITVTALTFGPLVGSAYSIAGCLLGAAATYAAGYFLGRDFVRRIAGSRWERLERSIDQAGVVAVASLRLIPVAPFTVINIVAGAFQVRLWDYFIGSLLGLAPGIIMINLFAYQFVSAVQNPGVGSFVLLAALLIGGGALSFWLRRRLSRNSRDKHSSV